MEPVLIVGAVVLFALWRAMKGGGRGRRRAGRPHARRPPPVPPSEQDAFPPSGEAKVLRVIDGDTVDVTYAGRRVRLRLSAIDCPEDGQPWGDMATAGLIKMIGGRPVRLETYGADRHGRLIATIHVFHGQKRQWINVNERMVILGHAWVMRAFYGHLPRRKQIDLNRMERWAQDKRVGLWRDKNPIPPWKWRRE